MKQFFSLFVALLGLSALPTFAQTLRPTVMAASGNAGLSINGAARLSFTLGETAIATNVAAGVACGQGFHNAAGPVSVGVADFDLAKWGLKVYPNPASESVTVEYAADKPDASVELSLWDLAGRRLLDPLVLPRRDVRRIEVGHLAQGAYFLRVTAPDGRSGSVPLIKAD